MPTRTRERPFKGTHNVCDYYTSALVVTAACNSCATYLALTLIRMRMRTWRSRCTSEDDARPINPMTSSRSSWRTQAEVVVRLCRDLAFFSFHEGSYLCWKFAVEHRWLFRFDRRWPPRGGSSTLHSRNSFNIHGLMGSLGWVVARSSNPRAKCAAPHECFFGLVSIIVQFINMRSLDYFLQ